jgi:tetratricopeptide (TPR) repeat protein
LADPSKSELLELARQAVSAEDYIRADEYYSQAIRFMPSSDPDYAECLECLVSLKQARGDFPAALEYSLRLIKLGEDMLGPDHALVGAWKKQVAHINAQLGRLSEGSGFPKPPPEPEIVLVPNPAPLPRPFQTPPGTSQNSTIKSQKSSGSFVESVDSDAPDKTLSMRRSTEVKKPARPSARSQQNLGALDNESDAGAIAKQAGKGKKGCNRRSGVCFCRQ